MLDHRYRDMVTAAEDAARQPGFDTVQRRARRLRLRRRIGTGAVAAVLLVLAAAGAVAVHRPDPATPPTDVPGSVPRLRWAGAADADHLYALVADCLDCPQYLFGSADGGRTWDQRGGSRPMSVGPGLTVVGPDILIDLGPSSIARAVVPQVSVDGGRTWRTLEIATTPVDAVPAGTSPIHCAVVVGPEPCSVYAVDPGTGRIAPLRTQPPVRRPVPAAVPATAGLWVQGLDQDSGRPATAVSHDGGRTWTGAVFDAEPVPPGLPGEQVAGMYLPTVATADGTVAYALFAGLPDQSPRVYRSGDAGRNWQRVDNGNPVPAPLAGPASVVLADGTHVVVTIAGTGFQYQASPDGVAYRPVELTGLPPTDVVPRAVTERFYLGRDGDALYTSADGRAWHRVVVR
jgi:hypothetical protein